MSSRPGVFPCLTAASRISTVRLQVSQESADRRGDCRLCLLTVVLPVGVLTPPGGFVCVELRFFHHLNCFLITGGCHLKVLFACIFGDDCVGFTFR